MFSPPDTVFGTPAKPRGNPRSAREGSVLIPLHESRVAHATFLRWNLADFEIGDEHLNSVDGWFLTIAIEVETAQFHLSQGNSVFWTTHCDLRVDAIDAKDMSPTTHRPNWARPSNRLWPQQDGTPLPFLGQATTSAYHVYLFGDATQIVVAHLDHRGEQDVEDHYDHETQPHAG